MSYDIALFDLDGTLTDPKAGITKSAAHALRSLGVAVESLDMLTSFIGPPLRASFRERYGFSDAQVELAVAKYREYFSETGIFENEMYPGIIPLLERLRGAGVTLAIATSKIMSSAGRIAEHFGFAQYFYLIAGSEPDGTRDEKAEVIAYALDRLDPGRERRAVMIGDREYDVIGANKAGIDSIGVTWGYGTRAELEAAGATRVVDDISELLRCLNITEVD